MTEPVDLEDKVWRPLVVVQLASMIGTGITFRLHFPYGLEYFSISSASVIYTVTLMNIAVLALSFAYVLIRYCKPAGDLSTERKFLLVWSIVFIITGLIAIAITVKSLYQIPDNRRLCPDAAGFLKVIILVVMCAIYLPVVIFKICIITRMGIHKGFCCFYASTVNTFTGFLYFLGISLSLWLKMTSPGCWHLRGGVELLYAICLLIQGFVYMFLALKVIKTSDLNIEPAQ